MPISAATKLFAGQGSVVTILERARKLARGLVGWLVRCGEDKQENGDGGGGGIHFTILRFCKPWQWP